MARLTHSTWGDLLDAQFQKVFAEAYKNLPESAANTNMTMGVALNSISHPSPDDMRGLYALSDEADKQDG